MEETKTSKVLGVLKKIWDGVKKIGAYILTDAIRVIILICGLQVVSYLIGYRVSSEMAVFFFFIFMILLLIHKYENK